jgi:anti-sigma regulatory factor (Ser/Thr protein kinase)
VITRQQIRSAMADGGRLIDPAGQPVGRIVDVVLGTRTMQPTWATVDCLLCTGAVVPLAGARLLDGDVQVPYTAADVCGAPRGERSGARLDRQWQEELRRHYAVLDEPGLDDLGLAWPSRATTSPGPAWREHRQWRWPSLPTSVRSMRVELRSVLDLTGLADDELDDLVLAAGEAANNAVEHAQRPTRPFFDVSTEVGEQEASIVIQDHGRWCTPSEGGNRGRGLQMIGVLADATVTVAPAGTTVVLRNRRPPAP